MLRVRPGRHERRLGVADQVSGEGVPRAAVGELAYAIQVREADGRPRAAFSRLRAVTCVVADGSAGS